MNDLIVRSDSRPRGLKAAVVGSLTAWIGRTIRLGDQGFWASFFGANNFSGQNVTVNSALQLSTAWACVRLISETMSTLPFFVYKERAGAKTVADSHQLYYLLHTQPNANMSACVFWQCFIASLLLWGGAYVEKRMSGDVITSLDFLIPDFVSWEKDPYVVGGGRWWYNDPDTGRRREITTMWYTPAFTIDGKTGLSPIAMGANVFGGAIAADRASADTFRNGMKASGLVTVDKVLTKDQRDQIRAHVKLVSESGGSFVLEKGTGFSQLNMNPQDAELLSTRAFNVEEICRWYRCPPFMVGHSEKSTTWGTGIEQQMIGFVTFVLRPWAVRIEQSVRLNLFAPAERAKMSGEFALEGLLRGDSASRAAFYSIMVQNGIYTRDDCRVKENLAPMEGNAAVLTVQSNLLPLDKLGENISAPSAAAANALKNWLEIRDTSDQPKG